MLAAPVITRYDDVEQGSPEWHAAREGGVFTGTGAHLLLGAKDAKRIVNGLVSTYAETQTSTFTGNFHTRRGHILEDQAARVYERVNEVTLHHTGYVTNSAFPRCLYSPDGIDDDNLYLIEIKCFSDERHLAIVKSGEVPLKIKAQVQFGMMITGFKRARLIFYHPKVEMQYRYKVFEIAANPLTQRQFKLALGGTA